MCVSLAKNMFGVNFHTLDKRRERKQKTIHTPGCVCVANCVLIQCMTLSISVAQGMGAKKQAHHLFMHPFKRIDR